VRSECSRSGVSHANRGVGRVGDRPCPSARRTVRQVDAAKEGHVCAQVGPCATGHDG